MRQWASCRLSAGVLSNKFGDVTMPSSQDAYSARADEYAQVLGSMGAMAPADRDLIARWAQSINGQIVDVGCGPGHWTAFLHELDCTVRGIDPVPRFIEIAKRNHPDVAYQTGGVADLADASADGLLTWYSLIHLHPVEVEKALARCWSALKPRGSLLLGFFDGERVEPFNHAISTAHYWPLQELECLLGKLGFTVVETEQRQDAGSRRHAVIRATKP